MYGGNDKNLSEIIAEVEETVIGQDAAVEWLCSFVDAACARSRIIRERNLDSLSLPSIGSALLVGPTASGKSHLLKTFAKASGLLFHPIDAGQMSAEGYKGNSFSFEWIQISAKLDANPGRNALVFIDEVDKLLAQEHEGWAGFDLLKPLEGGVLRGSMTQGEPWTLDCDRCIFVLAGAFTGIEEIVLNRIGSKASGVGFAAPGGSSPTPLLEDELRGQVSLEDVEAWGAPRELVGRISTVKFINALGENALHAIIRNNKQDEYSAMLPGNARFSIDAAAEDILVKKALTANYGARFINQQLNGLFCGEIWRAVVDAGAVASVSLTAREGELAFHVEAAKANDRTIPAPEEDRLSAKAAYGLLRDVRECVEKHRGLPWLDAYDTLGEDCAEYAASLLCQDGSVVMRERGVYIPNDFSLAEIVLVYALYTLLRDWFPESDHTPDGMKQLLSLTRGKHVAKSSLDLMFYQIESGKRYVPNANHDPNDPLSPTWAWADSNFVRTGDGLRPAKRGGMKPGEDRALDYYSEFKSYPHESQQQAIGSLALRLL